MTYNLANCLKNDFITLMLHQLQSESGRLCMWTNESRDVDGHQPLPPYNAINVHKNGVQYGALCTVHCARINAQMVGYVQKKGPYKGLTLEKKKES